ncbi:TRAFAC clade GTPase domain-containing protein [Sphingomonas radiodurans]|uniref:TRAFAC clade GTPase domain-containing protein n=1 Tax=Sphingomonas radiodurans TaxID=2890321 RepID=UPI001E2F4CED|nr:hypothetical protein [Sphingomonas radiodurans]WBH16492.1 hypothetical protein LLW23_17165 [Sphingomonas radiodurans]
MIDGSIILVGGPASGKTNYIARLWLAFQAKKGTLRADHLPENVEYVNEAVSHVLSRKFAPRSERNMEESARRDFTLSVRGDEGAGPARNLTVPDITGELWKRALETYELPQEWIDALAGCSSAIIFIRANSKLNRQPMDWVTAREVLKGHEDDDDDDTEEDDADYGLDEDEDGEQIARTVVRPLAGQPATTEVKALAVSPEEGPTEPILADAEVHATSTQDVGLPAQVGFCELVRYLTVTLGERPDGSKPRVAVVVTAWDTIHPDTRAAGPAKYLQDQFPMLAGRLRVPGRLEFGVFGMSIVGGNLRNAAFRRSLKRRNLSDLGYTAVMRDGGVAEDPDVTLPLAWALGD